MFSFTRNPKVWSKLLNEYTIPEEVFPFCDDITNTRLANSRFECYYFAINEKYDSIAEQLSRDVIYSGELSDFCASPDLFLSVLEQCPNVTYDKQEKSLNFLESLTPEELMQIDTLLINPTILISKVPIDESIISNESIDMRRYLVDNHKIEENYFG